MRFSVSIHPDETLSSVVAGALRNAGAASRRGVGARLCGQVGAVLRGDYPMRLDVVSAAFGYPVMDLVSRTTSFPLRAPFMDEATYSRLLSAIRTGAEIPTCILATHAERATAARRLRWCERCRDHDLDSHGVTWWRRTHQSPGVRCCPIHGCGLVDSQFPAGSAWKVDYPSAEDATRVRQLAPPTRLEVGLANDVRFLLQLPPKPRQSGCLRGVYFDALQSAGYVHGGRLRRSDFLNDFRDQVGRRQLGMLGLSFDPSSEYSWPAKIVVCADRPRAPLKHLCALNFLGLDAARFVAALDSSCPKAPPRRGPSTLEARRLAALWKDRKLSLNEIARRLGKQAGTVRAWASSAGLALPRPNSEDARVRHLETCRAARRSLLAGRANPGSASRRWLARNDAAWFRRNAPPRVAVRPRVNWSARDALLARRVPRAAAKVERVRPFRRVTLHTIAAGLGCAGILSKQARHVPRFIRAAKAREENGVAYALRRIRCLRREHPKLPGWKLAQKAGISGPLRKAPAVLRVTGMRN